MPSNLEQVRAAILKVFGNLIADDVDEAKKIIKEATYTGKTDPGGWERSAEVVIHCESGIPNGMFEDGHLIMDKWSEVTNQLDGLFCEHYNAAIVCVYYV